MTTISGVLNRGIKKKRRKEKLPKIVAYLSCSTGRTHFARTNLGFTKEDKVRFVLVTEMFETDMISFNSLNVPRYTFQIQKFTT